MKKKGIVLLISLFFMTAIGVLIFESLKYSEEMLTSIQKEKDMIQMQISLQNIKEEIIDMIYKNKDNLDTILPIEDVQINVENQITIDVKTIESYIDKLNIHKQKLSTDLESYMEGINITNNKQLKFILNSYLKTHSDTVIEEQKDNFAYFDTDSLKFVYCAFDIDMESSQGSSEMIFNTDTKEVVDFEFILKR